MLLILRRLRFISRLRAEASWLVLALASIALVTSSAARAGDGVLEINQTCAVTTGCFAGDSAGFPVNIGTAPGASSFILTSDLDVRGVATPENVTAMRLFTAGIRIDLNGFSIFGPGVAGTGLGIDATNVQGVSIRDGKIVGMGSHGVRIGPQGEVVDVTAVGNGANGILTDTRSYVSGCIAYLNGADGITLASGVVEQSGSHTNGLDGIEITNTAIARHNSATSNGADGFDTRFHNQLRGNAARGNAGFALNATGATSGYSENVLNSGGAGTVGGGASIVQMGPNLCGGNTVCP